MHMHPSVHAHMYTYTHNTQKWGMTNNEILHLASFMLVMCSVGGEAALAVGKGNIQQANTWRAEILLVVITVKGCKGRYITTKGITCVNPCLPSTALKLIYTSQH